MRKTLFCVDTYELAARGRLTVKDHREFKTAEECVQRAAYIAPKVAGALAYSIEADHEFEDYSEPCVLARHGLTPDE
jgi:hypothetical protein